MKVTHRPSRSRRGFLMLDIISGLVLMTVTIVLMANITARSRVAARRLADDRAATRLAEMTLLRLDADANAAADNVVITPLEAEAPPGRRWVRASATVNGRRVSLVGLARASTPTTEAAP